jgi:MFS family permease
MLTIYAIVILFPFTIFAGWLSDKYGRKPITLSGLILGSIFIFPAFEMLHRLSNLYITSHDYSLLWLIGLILSTLSFSLGLVIGPQTALLTELFPAKSRNSAATLSHNLAAGWIGGSLPFVVTFLNQQFNSNLIGLLYPTIFLALAALVCYLYFPETKDTDLN